MRVSSGLFFLLIILNACTGAKETKSETIVGNWYFDQWTLYHTLSFTPGDLTVSNHVDTVYRLKYAISHDTLFLSPSNGEQYLVHIHKLTSEELVLDHIPGIDGERTYTHKPQDWLK